MGIIVLLGEKKCTIYHIVVARVGDVSYAKIHFSSVSSSVSLMQQKYKLNNNAATVGGCQYASMAVNQLLHTFTILIPY